MTETSSLPLPLSFDEFSPDWMTHALSGDFPGAKVSGLSRDAERIGTSASCRFSLEYADRGRDGKAPDYVYVKGGFDPMQRKRYWMALQQEVLFYKEFADDVPMNIPYCYFAESDDRQQGITMLEDFVSKGVTFGNWGSISVDQMANLLGQFARMHAKWWNAPKLKTLTDYEVPQRNFLKYMVRDKHWVELEQREYGDLLVDTIATPEQVRAGLDRVWELNDAMTPTLVHGDAHGGNMFFEADGSPGVLDFQLYFSGAFMHDVSWLITSGLSIEDRRSEERRLLAHYREQAAAAGQTDLPDDEKMWLMHRQQSIHAFVSGGCEPIEAGPLETINKAAYTTLTAANDHEVLKALGIS